MNDIDLTLTPEWAIGIGYSHKHGDWQWFDHGHYMHHKGGVKFPFNSSFDMSNLTNVTLTCDKQRKQHNVPPVGTECLMFIGDQLVGDQVLIMGHFEDLVWVTVQTWDNGGVYSGINQTFNANNVKFQYIKSEKEKWVDLARKSFVNANVGSLTTYEMNCIDVTHDALISGELPIPKGVKK